MSELDKKDDEQPSGVSSDQIADMLDAESASEDEAERVETEKSEETEHDKLLKAKAAESFGMVCWSIQSISSAAETKWPCLEFPEKQKLEVANKTTLVLAKYDYNLPPWLKAYKEEIDLGLMIGGIVAGSYMTVQKQKKIDAEKIVKTEGEADGSEPKQSFTE